jgi:hypothetical protein
MRSLSGGSFVPAAKRMYKAISSTIPPRARAQEAAQRSFSQLPTVRANTFSGVTAAAVGAIAGAAVILSRRALVDVPTVLIAVITFAALLRLRKIPEPMLILVAGVAGIALYPGDITTLGGIDEKTLLLFTALVPSSAFAQTLKEVAKFDLPGPGGKRFDYLKMTATTISFLLISQQSRPM